MTRPIDHEKFLQWLQETAESLIEKTLVAGTTSVDLVYMRHTLGILQLGFLYLDLRNGICWKFWLPHFISTGCKNYAAESISLVVELYADLPQHLFYCNTEL